MTVQYAAFAARWISHRAAHTQAVRNAAVCALKFMLTWVQAWRVAGVENVHSGRVVWWNSWASKCVAQVRKHAVWKSRWGTYLKLCSTTWDRKWDTVNGFAVKSPARLHSTTPLSLKTHCVNHYANILKWAYAEFSSDSIWLLNWGCW